MNQLDHSARPHRLRGTRGTLPTLPRSRGLLLAKWAYLHQVRVILGHSLGSGTR